MVLKIDKPWGYELIFAKTRRYVGKVLFVRSGESLSLQFHRKKDETIFISQGRIEFRYGSVRTRLRRIILKQGKSFHIPPGMIHRMRALKDTYMFEVSTPELKDVVRLEDLYGRAPAK